MSFGRGLYFSLVTRNYDIKAICDHQWRIDEWHPDWEECIRCGDVKKKGELIPFGL